MTQKQLSDLVFSIGETVLLEVKEIKRVDYPKTEFPNMLYIELLGGEKLELVLRQFGGIKKGSLLASAKNNC